ncbi:DNA cytosine methyltransferase [Streptomyces sp. SID11385]|uniref:DNA cytosine methyltransferase n=1 Tax=Streptomyces sp. SID11385 TaxID=2706031 RepID=UPI0013C91E69|nr:DNA cytosine methyltransferase [Streptomyces sp. SID11385]NEA40936.1 DNA cytosine methyltransferase [Streptomyces sp. SID11385]
MAGGYPRPQFEKPLTSVEICAGAGGQALGLHNAGFEHEALVEWDTNAVETLRTNSVKTFGWSPEKAERLRAMDVRDFRDEDEFKSLKKAADAGQCIDLFAGGVPCPPFSLAGRQLGPDDERDLFPDALELIGLLKPKAVMLENVRGILEPPEVFIEYRREIIEKLKGHGYSVPEVPAEASARMQSRAMHPVWRRLDANKFGVPQLRPRAILVAFREDIAHCGDFRWPVQSAEEAESVFDVLREEMRERYEPYWNKRPLGPGSLTGKQAFERWETAASAADARKLKVAPTLVGGSRKHGGADLGPTRAKRAWQVWGVNGEGLANDPAACDPERDLFRDNGPMLTVQQAAAIQGFPAHWTFEGKKTTRYRQVGNAFPPPVAEAVGRAIAAILRPGEAAAELLRPYEMDGAVALRARAEETLQVTKDPDAQESLLNAAAGNDRRRDPVSALF